MRFRLDRIRKSDRAWFNADS